MTNEELTLYNIGENLDSLMTLDPRGYGVCRILYRAARDYAGEPLSVHAAKGLVAHIHSGDLVYIITGFVLLPWKQPETDGMVSSMMLARFLIKAPATVKLVLKAVAQHPLALLKAAPLIPGIVTTIGVFRPQIA